MAQIECSIHGPFEAQEIVLRVGDKEVKFQTTCPACDAEAETAKAASRVVVNMEDGKKRVVAAGIPPLYRDCSFKNFNAYCERLLKIEGFLKRLVLNFDEEIRKPGKNVILYGDPGTGKTHLSIATLKMLAQAGFTAIYGQEQQLLMEIKEADWGKKASVRERYIKPDVLVMDELAQIGRHTENDTKELFQVINERISNLRPTIYVSNKSPEEIESIYGEVLWSRIAQKNSPMIHFSRQHGLINYRFDSSADL